MIFFTRIVLIYFVPMKIFKNVLLLFISYLSFWAYQLIYAWMIPIYFHLYNTILNHNQKNNMLGILSIYLWYYNTTKLFVEELSILKQTLFTTKILVGNLLFIYFNILKHERWADYTLYYYCFKIFVYFYFM